MDGAVVVVDGEVGDLLDFVEGEVEDFGDWWAGQVAGHGWCGVLEGFGGLGEGGRFFLFLIVDDPDV